MCLSFYCCWKLGGSVAGGVITYRANYDSIGVLSGAVLGGLLGYGLDAIAHYLFSHTAHQDFANNNNTLLKSTKTDNQEIFVYKSNIETTESINKYHL